MVMKQIKNIIENKSVAIVGPASNIENYEYGEFIDSHDVVIRLNEAFSDASTGKNHRGKKTDVVYFDGSSRRIETVVSNINSHFVLRQNKLSFDIVDAYFYDELTKQLNDKRSLFNEKRNIRPNTGTVALFHTIALGAKEMFVSGINFYSGSTRHYGKANDWGSKSNTEIKQILEGGDGPDVHHTEIQLMLFKELCNNNKEKISLYPPLEELVNEP
jgi:hypothetical protein